MLESGPLVPGDPETLAPSPCFSRSDFWKFSASLVTSISRLTALMRCVVSLALFFRSFKMALFSLKMRLISLPRSFLKSSKAKLLGGGVLGLGQRGGQGGDKQVAVLQVMATLFFFLGASVGRRPTSWVPPTALPQAGAKAHHSPLSLYPAHKDTG